MAQILPSISTLALTVGLSVALAWAFRRAGFRHGGMLAGLLVGILCGPTIAGRLMPETWTTLVLGATDARIELQAARSEFTAWRTAAASTGLAGEALAAASIERRTTIADLETRLAEETVAHARPWSVCLVGGATLLVLLSRIATRTSSGRPGPAGLAAWASVLPGLTTLVALRLWGADPFSAQSLLIVACVSCGSWSIPRRSNALLRRLRAGPIAWSGNRGAILAGGGWAVAAGVVGTPAWSVAVVALVPFLLPATIRPRLRETAARVLESVVIPGIAALAVLRIEAMIETSVFLIVVLTVVAGDGRAFGWLIGLRFEGVPTTGRRGGSWVVSMLASDASSTQLALASAGIALGGLGAAAGFALVASAAVVQALTPLRWWFARLDSSPTDGAEPETTD